MFGTPGVRFGLVIAAATALVVLRIGPVRAEGDPLPVDPTPAPAEPPAPIVTPVSPAPPAGAGVPITGAPVTDDLGKARPLAPMPGLRAKIEPPKKEGPKEPEGPSNTLIIGAGRWVALPKELFGLFFDEAQTFNAPSIALGVELGPDNGTVWGFELNWTALIPHYGNWLQSGKTPDSATYAESRLHMISLDAAYRRHYAFTKAFGGFLGAGLGVGFLVGNIETTDVLPTCVEPVSKCAHWPNATRRNVELPTRVVPVLHFLAGLQVKATDEVVIRLQGGFRDVFYLGLGVGTFF
jgi:hypothetical protein